MGYTAQLVRRILQHGLLKSAFLSPQRHVFVACRAYFLAYASQEIGEFQVAGSVATEVA